MSSYRTDVDSAVRIQTEGSNKEDITVTTNLSASGTFYTLMQGKVGLFFSSFIFETPLNAGSNPLIKIFLFI